MSGPIQLYVHVPFCEKKCHYCDFASWELPAVQQRRWTEIILKEIADRAHLAQGRPVDTVFFGGGTPSLLATEFLERIVAEIRARYDLSRMREMSIECNPSSLKKDKLDLYHRLGFTRMSIGIQSFHAEELARLGRVHTPETARLALETVKADGRFQFSGDLIFGVPGQTEASFLASLGILISLEPDHVSFYGLTIEEGTEFAKQRASGALIMPEDGIYNGMYTAGVELLRRHGFQRYEVSNFSQPGKPSLHNRGYWTGVEYLAFGPGAHSFFAGKRTVSPRSFEGYLEWGGRGFDAASCVEETLTPDNLVSEAVLLGLRQADGVHLGRLRDRGFTLPQEVLGKWEKVGMLSRDGETIRLIDEGWLFLDEIGSDLLARGVMKRAASGAMNFDLQPTLENEFVKIRPLREDDFETLYSIACDPLIWEQHPNKNRYKKEPFGNYFKGAMESQGAFLAFNAKTGKPIGSSRFYAIENEGNSIAIGYTFLARDHWGTTYNRALKTLMLDHAFRFVNSVIFHIGAVNIRSRKAIEKLGAKKIGEAEVEYYGEATTLNFIYRIDKEKWNHGVQIVSERDGVPT